MTVILHDLECFILLMVIFKRIFFIIIATRTRVFVCASWAVLMLFSRLALKLGGLLLRFKIMGMSGFKVMVTLAVRQLLLQVDGGWAKLRHKRRFELQCLLITVWARVGSRHCNVFALYLSRVLSLHQQRRVESNLALYSTFLKICCLRHKFLSVIGLNILVPWHSWTRNSHLEFLTLLLLYVRYMV